MRTLALAALMLAASPVMAATSIASAFTRTSAGESLMPLFTTPVGAQSQRAYSGLVEVFARGRGSIGLPSNNFSWLSDAFYTFNYDQGGDYYDLSLGSQSQSLSAYTPSQTITRAIVFMDGIGAVAAPYRPAPSASYEYRFVIDLGLIGVNAPQLLQFGVTEGQYNDNDGHYDLTIWQLASGGSSVPEPASWALLLAGFGAVGGALRARRAGGATVQA
ncbi:MAG: hypothetical protein CFE37_13215 [Alphaproteobacteria bacterium PA4]|nr:MAG: hypothetical protein CFE37_13215 [Alphaproteobacteria bacterium PA4]